jgi:hypothetical protein
MGGIEVGGKWKDRHAAHGGSQGPSPARNALICRSTWVDVGDQGRPLQAFQNMIPAAKSTTSCCQGADLLRIAVASPPNGEIIDATPALVRVSREAAEDEEKASSVH